MDFKNLKYTALGDSITWGQDGCTHQRMEKPFCEIVKEMLNLKAVTNLGIGWSTTAHLEVCKCHDFHNAHDPMCERTDAIPLDSDIISLNGGVNDRGLNIPLGTYNSRDTTTYLGAFNVLIDKTIERCPNAWVFIIAITPTKASYKTGLKNEAGLYWDDYSNAIRELSKIRKIDFLEDIGMNKILEDFNRKESDGVHPSQDCIRNTLANSVAKFIENHYKNEQH